MTDDIVAQLHKECEGLGCWHPMFPQWERPCVFCKARYEIQRLRQLAEALYQETKRCGSKHDVKATNEWEEYEEAYRGDR